MSNSNSDIQISIIVPVYNVRDYIERCLDSLISQTFRNIEIIIVNDGSTDGSDFICEKYAKNDSRILVIHQQNKGLSEARNAALKKAIGKYVLFVDSDDYICLDACEKLYNLAEKNKCDIVAGNEIKVVDGIEIQGLKRNIEIDRIYTGKDFLVTSIKRKSISMCAPFALYRTKLIIDHKHFFESGLLHEDELWTPQTYLLADKVICTDLNFYYHYYREGSITTSKNKEKNSRDLIRICKKLYKIYAEIDKKSRNFLNDYLCMLYLNAIFIGNNRMGDRLFAIKLAYSWKNRLKALLYFVSPNLYIYLNTFLKKKK